MKTGIINLVQKGNYIVYLPKEMPDIPGYDNIPKIAETYAGSERDAVSNVLFRSLEGNTAKIAMDKLANHFGGVEKHAVIIPEIKSNLVSFKDPEQKTRLDSDYFKYLKYGFGRATDQVNNHIRRNRISRTDAVKIIEKIDGKFPWTYLGRKINDILDEVDMELEEFINICDRFTNKKIFLCDKNKKLIKDSKGNLKKLNYDNIEKLVTDKC